MKKIGKATLHAFVAVFIGCLRDFGTTDTIDFFSSVDTPKKLTIGLCIHTGCKDSVGAPWDFITEHIRWYDYWLKGIDNSIMDELQVMIYSDGAEEWKTYAAYPLVTNENCVNYYLHEKASGTISSKKDGSLSAKSPADALNAVTVYTADFDTSKQGFTYRNWYDTLREDGYTALDKRGLTFTTDPFAEETSIVGSPILCLWMRAEVPDIDFFAYLELIDENGVSTDITEGRMRASFRKLVNPPYNRNGCPWHQQMYRNQKPLPKGEPVRLDFDLLAMSRTVLPGQRPRLTLTNYDKLKFDSPTYEPAPQVTVYHNREKASWISRPVFKGDRRY